MTQTALTREQVMKASGAVLDVMVAVHILKEPVVPLHGEMMIMKDKSYHFIPNYSGNIFEAWKAVSVMEHDEAMQEDYAIELHNVLGLMLHEPTTLENVYQIAHATPEQRCKAALLAVLDL